MKKQITSLASILAATFFCAHVSINAQNTFPASGNVGVGTLSPAELLHVNGNVRGGSSGGALRISTGNGTFDIGPQNASWCHLVTDRSDFYFGTNIHVFGAFSSYNGTNLRLATGQGTNEIVRITALASNGNVGIGTSSPTDRLSIAGGGIGWGNSNASNTLSTDQGGSMEVGAINWGTNPILNGTPFIDFHFGTGTAQDYNARIINNANNQLDFNTNSGGTVMTIKGSSVGIGTLYIPAGYKLAVGGKIIAEEVLVKLQANWPDYVFKKEYDLKSLQDVEEFIKTNQHLPGIPSASEIEKNGVTLGEMSAKQMEKIEELTLYVIELEKKIQKLETMGCKK